MACTARTMRATPSAARFTSVRVYAATATKSVSKSKGSAKRVEIDLKKAFSDSSYVPPRAIGPVEVSNSKGNGVVLMTTAEVRTGELLLVSHPLGPVLRGEARGSLRIDELFEEWKKQEAFSASVREKLALLPDGSFRKTRSRVTLASFGPESVKKAPAGPKKGFGAKPKEPEVPPSVDLDDAALETILQHNAWGQNHDDLAAAPLRGEKLTSFVGVWPEISLIPHSCAPNTITMNIGDAMLLRSVCRLPANVMLTTNTLGHNICAPLEVRRRLLRESYGWVCNCGRCQMEEQIPEEVSEPLRVLYEYADTLESSIRKAVQVGDAQVVGKALHDLQGLVDSLEEAMETHNVMQEAHRYIRASAYDAYKLLSALKDSSEPKDPNLAIELHAIVAAIMPGSDVHLFLASEWATRTASVTGKESESTIAATRALITAINVRYGELPLEPLTQVIHARTQYTNHLGGYDLPTDTDEVFGASDLLPLFSETVVSDGATPVKVQAPTGLFSP